MVSKFKETAIGMERKKWVPERLLSLLGTLNIREDSRMTHRFLGLLPFKE